MDWKTRSFVGGRSRKLQTHRSRSENFLGRKEMATFRATCKRSSVVTADDAVITERLSRAKPFYRAIEGRPALARAEGRVGEQVELPAAAKEPDGPPGLGQFEGRVRAALHGGRASSTTVPDRLHARA